MQYRTVVLVACVALLGCNTSLGPGRSGNSTLWKPREPVISPTLCELWTQGEEVDRPGFHLDADFDKGNAMNVLRVVVKNTGTEPIQALLQEWSITDHAGTGAISTGDIPRGQIASAVLPPATIPPGADWRNVVFPRSHHSMDSGLDTLVRWTRECSETVEVKLTYVVLVGEKRVIGTTTVTARRKEVANPAYKG